MGTSTNPSAMARRRRLAPKPRKIAGRRTATIISSCCTSVFAGRARVRPAYYLSLEYGQNPAILHLNEYTRYEETPDSRNARAAMVHDTISTRWHHGAAHPAPNHGPDPARQHGENAAVLRRAHGRHERPGDPADGQHQPHGHIRPKLAENSAPA